MPADPLVKRSATWMAQAVRDGDVSAAELLDARADRIEARNPAVNAIVLLVAHRPLGVRAALDHARGLELAQPRVSTSRGAPVVSAISSKRRRPPGAAARARVSGARRLRSRAWR